MQLCLLEYLHRHFFSRLCRNSDLWDNTKSFSKSCLLPTTIYKTFYDSTSLPIGDVKFLFLTFCNLWDMKSNVIVNVGEIDPFYSYRFGMFIGGSEFRILHLCFEALWLKTTFFFFWLLLKLDTFSYIHWSSMFQVPAHIRYLCRLLLIDICVCVYTYIYTYLLALLILLSLAMLPLQGKETEEKEKRRGREEKEKKNHKCPCDY